METSRRIRWKFKVEANDVKPKLLTEKAILSSDAENVKQSGGQPDMLGKVEPNNENYRRFIPRGYKNCWQKWFKLLRETGVAIQW